MERDVKEQVQLADPLLFRDFVRAAACRAAQMLNVHDIAQDVGVSDDTAKRWLRVLEKSDVIFFILRPYSNNLLKRTVKTPTIYFFDTGLAANLTRYSSPEILANGAISGAILENMTTPPRSGVIMFCLLSKKAEGGAMGFSVSREVASTGSMPSGSTASVTSWT